MVEYSMDELDEFYFQWHITETCNLRCKHCYHNSYESKGELTQSQLETVFSKMEDALDKWQLKGSVSLTGGEPFFRRAELYFLTELFDQSQSILYYDILTNGTLLEKADLELLSHSIKLRRIQLSLESPFRDENDSIRGVGSFDLTLNAIRKLKEHGLQVSVMMTATKENLDSIPAMYDLLILEKVDAFALERFIPEGNGAWIKEKMLSKEEVKRLYESIYRIGIDEKRIRTLMHRPLFALINPDDPTLGAMCSVGTNALTIMHDGTVYPCRRLPISIGNILKDSIYKIWYDSDLLWTVRNANNLEGKCSQCELVPLCRGCRAMAYFISNNYLAEDPHCWKKAPFVTS